MTARMRFGSSARLGMSCWWKNPSYECYSAPDRQSLFAPASPDSKDMVKYQLCTYCTTYAGKCHLPCSTQPPYRSPQLSDRKSRHPLFPARGEKSAKSLPKPLASNRLVLEGLYSPDYHIHPHQGSDDGMTVTNRIARHSSA
jgi:hypothetical protein